MDKYFGKYRGIVVDIDDPEKRGRIRVKCPTVLGKTNISNWALPCFPPRQFVLPQVNDLVWMEFEGGYRDEPIWTGVFYTIDQFSTLFGATYNQTDIKFVAENDVSIVAKHDVSIDSENLVSIDGKEGVDIDTTKDVDVTAGEDFNTTTGGANNLN